MARACGRKLCSNNLAMVCWIGGLVWEVKTGDGKTTNPGRKKKKHITQLLGTAHWKPSLWSFGVLPTDFQKFFDVCHSGVTWSGFGSGFGIVFALKEGMPAYLAIKSSKANPNSS